MHDPTEHVQEHIQHTAVHGDHAEHAEHRAHAGHGHAEHANHSAGWITAAALSAAILAALAAISGMLGNSTLKSSTDKRIDANDQWSYYQAKSIKSSNIDTRMLIVQVAGKPPRAHDLAEKAKYAKEMPAIQERAEANESLAEKYLESYETFEWAETLFHISIAIVAIAVVAKRRSFWYISLVGGVVGAYFFMLAIGRIPPLPSGPEHAEAKSTVKTEATGHSAVGGESPIRTPAASAPAPGAE